jgi:diacylglycerol O-acyltransferase / wax synthase
VEQLSGLDSALVQGEVPNVPLHMSALFVYDPSTSASGTISFNQIRQLFLNVIESSLPILKSRAQKIPFILDKPYWVNDDNFTIDYHIERFALPHPGNWAALHDVAGHFHAQPLNPERPLWQAIYLENLDHLAHLPAGCVGLLLKIHHSLVDGKTAFRIFSALHTLSPEPDAPLILKGTDNKEADFTAPDWLTTYRRAYWHTISSPFKLMKNVADIASKAMRSDITTAPPSALIPDTPFNSGPSADRILGHIRAPLKKMHQLEKASGCTINDIALSIIGGALKDYLQQQGQTPEQSLVAGMPIDIRSSEDKNAIGNQLSFVNLSLHTDIDDAQNRLAAIHQASSESRKKNKRVGPKSLISIVDNLHPGAVVWIGKKVISSRLINKIPRLHNTIITNVPGIPVPCYLGGAKLVDYLGFGPLTPIGSLFHVVSSTDTHINISFLSCSNSLKDQHAYRMALENSYKQLLAAFDIA